MSRLLQVGHRLSLAAILAILLVLQGFAPLRAASAASCLDLLENGDMESGAGWMFELTPILGDYSSDQFVSPARSARLGVVNGENIEGSSAMRQTVVVPEGDSLTLSLQVLPLSEPPDPNDLQEVQIRDASATQILRTLWQGNGLSNAASWQTLEFDISEFIGQEISIYIHVYNDGAGGATALYVDDAQLTVCSQSAQAATPTNTPTPVVATATPTPSATPTPVVITNTPTPTPLIFTATPTPSATPTPIVITNTPTPTPEHVTATVTPAPGSPTGAPAPATDTPIPPPPTETPTLTPAPPPGPVTCKECLKNTSFENWKAWYFGKTKQKGGYSGAQAHTGLRSARLGNVNPEAPNYKSYSSLRQRVTIPRGKYRTAELRFWHYTISDGDPGDRQELIILDARTGRTLEVLWRVNRNDREWREEVFDLTRYMGRSIIIYFNVYNNGEGGRAAMYVDDVTLGICPVEGSAPPPPPPPSEPPTPTAVSEVIVIIATPIPEVIVVPATPGGPTPIPEVIVMTPTPLTPQPEEINPTPTPDLVATVSMALTLTPAAAIAAAETTATPPPTMAQRLVGAAAWLLAVVIMLIIIAIAFFIRSRGATEEEMETEAPVESEPPPFPPSPPLTPFSTPPTSPPPPTPPPSTPPSPPIPPSPPTPPPSTSPPPSDDLD
ncbi:MAG: hypothetical protein GXP42_18870 [Chloroflexi bacterium]|nr:hypothetical protein [Chloroflexota bacterium]